MCNLAWFGVRLVLVCLQDAVEREVELLFILGGGDNLKNLKNRKLFSAWAMASWLELKFNNPAGTMFICSEFWGTQRAKDR